MTRGDDISDTVRLTALDASPAPAVRPRSEGRPHGSPAAGGWRVDIQVLRALAVILVVLQHARVPYLPGGFLGVDIFFVISGYLMTGLIVDAIDAGRFTFSDFYARRARRLFPAAYATIVVTVLAAPWLLDPYEFRNLVEQVAGSFSFTVNMVLWRQVDYFNSGAALKPLLHMWSLSVEEQFYIVVPVLLLFCPARRRLRLTALLVAASLALCAYCVRHSPSAAFYFLPFRAWELGFGSLAALVARRGGLWPGIAPLLRPACALGLVLVPILVGEGGHPGLPALGVCIATALLLVTGSPRQGAGPLAPLAAIGDRSYSLYLVHWPILAFANNVLLAPPGPLLTLVLLASCGIWMEAQYRLVERRYRALPIDRRTLPVLIAIPLVVTGLAFAWSRLGTPVDLAARQGNKGLSDACVFADTYEPRPICRTSARPTTLVWGDSFAMHLVQGLAATMPDGIEQATRYVCGPFLGIAPIDGAQYPRPWGESCLRFNRSVIDALAARPDLATVVLSSSLVQYIPGAEAVEPWQTLVQEGEGTVARPLDAGLLEAALARTVAALHRIGKRVVLVAPPPALDFDIGRCLSRADAGKPTISPYRDCRFSRADYERGRARVLRVLADIRDKGLVEVLSLDEALCGDGTCRTRLDGVPLYRDEGHLSAAGSRRLGERIDLGGQVRARAR